MAHAHARAATRCGSRVVGCVDSSASRARAFASSHGIKASKDLATLLNRDDVDVIVIATPTPSHAQCVVAAARAGKDILCEAPLSATLKDARRAMRCAESAGVHLFVGHSLRYCPAFQALAAQVKQGSVGDVGFVRICRSAPRPLGAKKWYRDPAQSNGIFSDLLIHDIDWIGSVLGTVRRVFCQARSGPKSHTWDYGQTTLTLETGAIVQIVSSELGDSAAHAYAELCGKDGMIRFDSRDRTLRGMSKSQTISPLLAGAVSARALDAQWQDFASQSTESNSLRSAPQAAMKAVAIMIAAQKSAVAGRPMEV